MKSISKSRKKWILFALITALAIALGCVFAACTKAQAESSDSSSENAEEIIADLTGMEFAPDGADTSAENYAHWLSDHYSADVRTREMWLGDLMNELGLPCDQNAGSGAIFAAAHKNGLTDSGDAEPYAALTRSYVAQTLVRALHYQYRQVDGVADLGGDKDMETVAYYGWFIPDDYNKVYPDALITAEEYDALVGELSRYRRLCGKQIISFGDSIMYGMGNSGRGIADMVGEKYGMKVTDFAISGAAFGVDDERAHIPDQIRVAAKTDIKPDIILIDGGTNDMEYVKRGSIMDGFDIKKANEKTFAGGFECSAALIRKYWKGVPVVYVRAHDMDRVDNAVERDYGETALAIAEKWDFAAVDIYHETEFCTEFNYVSDAYTVYKAWLGKSDGIHPTALGYAKYYVPSVAAKIEEIFS